MTLRVVFSGTDPRRVEVADSGVGALRAAARAAAVRAVSGEDVALVTAEDAVIREVNTLMLLGALPAAERGQLCETLRVPPESALDPSLVVEGDGAALVDGQIEVAAITHAVQNMNDAAIAAWNALDAYRASLALPDESDEGTP